MLALTPADFDFEKGTVKISKTYQRLKGQDVITSPKTKKSKRTVSRCPIFSVTEMQELFQYAVRAEKERPCFYRYKKLSAPRDGQGCKRSRGKAYSYPRSSPPVCQAHDKKIYNFF